MQMPQLKTLSIIVDSKDKYFAYVCRWQHLIETYTPFLTQFRLESQIREDENIDKILSTFQTDFRSQIRWSVKCDYKEYQRLPMKTIVLCLFKI
jgi:hypothetical protein